MAEPYPLLTWDRGLDDAPLRPFSAEVELLSMAGQHDTATYLVRGEVLNQEHILVHEEIHDRLLFETPDGYLLTRLVRLVRDPETPG